eukprot:Gb_00918 [translate_table: standard]
MRLRKPSLENSSCMADFGRVPSSRLRRISPGDVVSPCALRAAWHNACTGGWYLCLCSPCVAFSLAYTLRGTFPCFSLRIASFNSQRFPCALFATSLCSAHPVQLLSSLAGILTSSTRGLSHICMISPARCARFTPSFTRILAQCLFATMSKPLALCALDFSLDFHPAVHFEWRISSSPVVHMWPVLLALPTATTTNNNDTLPSPSQIEV